MTPEPVEVEVLNKDGTPAIPAKKHSLANPINVLAFIFALLTSLMILLVGIASVIEKKARELDEEPPPGPE